MASLFDGGGRGLNVLSREAPPVATLLHAEVTMAISNESHFLRAARDQVGLN